MRAWLKFSTMVIHCPVCLANWAACTCSVFTSWSSFRWLTYACATLPGGGHTTWGGGDIHTQGVGSHPHGPGEGGVVPRKGGLGAGGGSQSTGVPLGGAGEARGSRGVWGQGVEGVPEQGFWGGGPGWGYVGEGAWGDPWLAALGGQGSLDGGLGGSLGRVLGWKGHQGCGGRSLAGVSRGKRCWGGSGGPQLGVSGRIGLGGGGLGTPGQGV